MPTPRHAPMKGNLQVVVYHRFLPYPVQCRHFLFSLFVLCRPAAGDKLRINLLLRRLFRSDSATAQRASPSSDSQCYTQAAFSRDFSVTISIPLPPPKTALSPRPCIPRGVWVLGFVSLLMDLSSELIHSLLPVFMVSALGASVLMVGIVEGVAESTALRISSL